jgi:hypothetical protein
LRSDRISQKTKAPPSQAVLFSYITPSNTEVKTFPYRRILRQRLKPVGTDVLGGPRATKGRPYNQKGNTKLQSDNLKKPSPAGEGGN